MKAIVCGGGIGGLAAAVAMRRLGIDAFVYERAPEIKEVGAGITMWTNAIKALRAIGVGDRVIARGDKLTSFVSRDADGDLLNEIDFRGLTEQFGAPSVCVHRAELQAELLRALPTGVVHAGRVVARVEQDERSATAVFDDGTKVEGDVVVGADGLRSAVRASVIGDVTPRYAGYTSWRGVVAAPTGLRDHDAWQATAGAGTQAAVFRCGGGRLYWFTTANAPPGGTDAVGGHRAAAIAYLEGWKGGALYRQIIEATPEENVVRADIHDLPTLKHWGVGRVTLLGDAAHATTPNLGQGGCMAIEDGLALAHALHGHRGDPAAGLRSYELERRSRAEFVVKQSRRTGSLLQVENALAVKVRDFLLTTSLGARNYEKVSAELFSYEPPASFATA